MREICTSGLTSGDWKRSQVSPDWGAGESLRQLTGATPPRQSSTLLLVPGGRWQTVMVSAEFVGQDLQFALPQAHARAVAAAAIGGDQQPRRRSG